MISQTAEFLSAEFLTVEFLSAEFLAVEFRARNSAALSEEFLTPTRRFVFDIRGLRDWSTLSGPSSGRVKSDLTLFRVNGLASDDRALREATATDGVWRDVYVTVAANDRK